MTENRSVAVSVVLVATNERPFLMAALDSLWATPPDLALEVVVVDNASTDGVENHLSM